MVSEVFFFKKKNYVEVTRIVKPQAFYKIRLDYIKLK